MNYYLDSLSKLPSAKHRIIYRGIKMNVINAFPKGKTFIWWAFSSSTSSMKVLEEFLAQSGHRTIFNIECDSAKDISQDSFYQSENEMIMYPARHLQQLIEQCEHRSEVNLGNQDLNEKDMEIVAKEIIINKQCDKLHLVDNKITAVGISTIARALDNNTSLQILYLGGDNLCDADIQPLTKMLSVNNSLERLLLSFNEISDREVELLANELTRHNTTLLSLRVSGHRLVSDVSVKFPDEMFKHNQVLTRLGIETCNFSKKGKAKVREIARSKKGFKLHV